MELVDRGWVGSDEATGQIKLIGYARRNGIRVYSPIKNSTRWTRVKASFCASVMSSTRQKPDKELDEWLFLIQNFFIVLRGSLCF